MIQNTLFLVGRHIIVMLVTIFITAVIARYLGKSLYGVFTYSFAFVNAFLAVSAFGLRSVAVRTIAQDRERASRYAGLMLSLRFMISFIVVAALLILSYFLHEDPLVRLTVGIASGTLVFTSLSTTLWDVFQGFEQLQYEAVSAIGIRLFTLFGALGVIWLNWNVVGLVSVYTAGAFVGFLIPLFFMVKQKLFIRPWFDTKAAFSELRKGVLFAANSFVGVLLTRINPILLGHLSTHAMVGIYTASSNLLLNLAFIPDAIATALFPTVARGFKESSIHVRPLLQKTFFYVLLVGLPIGVGGTICAESIVLFIFGPAFRETVPVFQLLVFTTPLRFLFLPAAYLLGAIDRQRDALIVSSIGAAFNLAGNFFLIPEFGAVGSAWAAVASRFFVCVGCLYFLSRYYSFFSSFSVYLRLVVANVAMAIVIFPLRTQNPIAVVPLGILVYVMAAVGLRLVTWKQIVRFARQSLGWREV